MQCLLPIPNEYNSLGRFPNSATREGVRRFPYELNDRFNRSTWSCSALARTNEINTRHRKIT